jgi:hypothetical protein
VSSENRHLGFWGIEEQETRDHRNHEFAKSDFPTVRGDQWRVPVGEDSRQGIRGALSLFGLRSVKVLVEAGTQVACAASEWYQSGEVFAFSRREEKTSCRLEEKGNHLIEKTGMREEEVGQQEI